MKLFHIILAGAALLVASSCSTKRSPLTYFKDIDTIEASLPTGEYITKVIPSDELFISVMSTSPDVTAYYNLPLVTTAPAENIKTYHNPEQQTYIVDTNGDIVMPVLGKVHVAGLTVEEIRDKLTEMISKDVADPVVRVQLVNFHINVAGEVTNPGTQRITTPRYSVLDALSAAGDLTVYGERDNVLVIREENGERIHGRINLNSAEALNSPFFYVKQNDYIYVEPNNIRKANSKYNQDNAYKLSVISTIVSACSVVASLIIALSR